MSVTVVRRWTGREARALRDALRMSVRAFATHTNLSVATIADMEAKGDQARLRNATQQILDGILATAPQEAHQRFRMILGPSAIQTVDTPASPGGSQVAGSKSIRVLVLDPAPASSATAELHGSPLVEGAEPHAVGVQPASRLGYLDGVAATGDPPASLKDHLTPYALDADQGAATNRRQILTTALGLSAVTGTAVGDMSQPRAPGGEYPLAVRFLPSDPDELEVEQGISVAAYGELSRSLWRMYWETPARPLFEAAYAQVRLGVDLLGGVAGADRHRVAGALALAALLTARLAFFDLNRPGAATRCHQVALTAANEAGDHAMVAVVLGHMAFGPAFARQSVQAGELTTVALASAQRAGAVVRSWLHCVTSEAEARAGNGPASLRQIDLADATFMADEAVPEWFDFYDRARLDCFAGYAAAVAGDHTLAADRLSRAAAELGRNGSKQRTVVCADLAAACRADADRAAHHLNEAINALEVSWYEVGWERVREARLVLGDSRLRGHIDQRLAILPGNRR